MRRATLLMLLALGAAGCTNVKPYERGYLARQDMQFDADPVDARFKQHIYGSKEAARGGYGVGGGGCGCN
jgi:hypothetical protein